MLKFNLNDIKKKLEEQKERSTKNKKDIHTDPLVRVEGPGEYGFRAIPYIHNEDYLSSPFAERFYHQGIPGTWTAYCPQENDREDCAVCEFVWEQLKENKGNKQAVDYWRKFLPKKKIWIPGLIRGREDEGVKFLAINTYKDAMSKIHEKLYKFLTHEKTFDFLDPQNGFDLILKYEPANEFQQKQFGSKFIFETFDLDTLTGRSPISKNPEETWAEIERTMKKVDELEKFEPKTSEDMTEILKKWLDYNKKNTKDKSNSKVDERKDDDGTVVDLATTTSATEAETQKTDTKPDPLKEVNKVIEDRKARARALIKT